MNRARREPIGGLHRTLIVVAVAFVAGALVDAGLTWRLNRLEASGDDAAGVPVIESPPGRAIGPQRAGPPAPAADERETERDARETEAGAGGPEAVATSGRAADDAAVDTLRSWRLDVPVQGIGRSELRDTFADARAANRSHDAIDIMAPRGTPVVAAQDGTVVKLFTSKAGGLTIYQFDPSSTFCYYYAHLDRYAGGLHEGQTVQRGELLGFVGSTGNASADAPHLHFAIFRLTPERRWWQGEPINPYPVLSQK